MSNTNDITGDQIKTKTSTESYRSNWDRIFGQKATSKSTPDASTVESCGSCSTCENKACPNAGKSVA